MFVPQNHNLQMSSCLSGSTGRAYALELDLIKSPNSCPTTTRPSNASSSTLSDSINSALAITTRKPRTPRKRPNQTYNEAAALLSTAYPSLFPLSSDLPLLFSHRSSIASDDYSSTFLLLPERRLTKPNNSHYLRPKLSCPSPGEICSSNSSSSSSIDQTSNYKYEEEDDFDAESMLDEEVDEGGIDSIMGNLSVTSSENNNNNNSYNVAFGYPMGLGFGIWRRAMRNVDEGNWWSFPAVDMMELSPRLRKPSPVAVVEKNNNKKKMKKVERREREICVDDVEERERERGLLLKLDYEGVLDAWCDKGSPFSDDAIGIGRGNDVAVGVFNSAPKTKCRKDRDKRKK